MNKDTENKDIVAKNSDVFDTEILRTAQIKEKKKNEKRKSVSKNSIEDPHIIIRRGMIVIFLFFGVLGVWSIFGNISGAVVAQGKVKIESERKTVQHLEGGIIESILVREGDHVISGQPLIVLESVQVDASVSMLGKQLVSFMATYARHTAEKDLNDTIDWPEELKSLAEEYEAKDVLANEQKIFTARRDALYGQISMLQSQVAQIDTQVSGLQEQYKAEEAIIGTLNEELRAKRQLYEERYLEKSQILELERMLASHRGTLGHLKQSIAESYQRKDETILRKEDIVNRFIEDATNQLGRLENEILQTKEKIRPLRDAKTRLNVTAPVTGRVVDLKVHSKGGVVRSGEPLLDIVPENNLLIIEVHIPVNKITDVYIGQNALVQLDAFDVRITPHLQGSVVYISADRFEEKTYQGDMPYYLCYVEIDPQSMNDADVYLSPGMPATIFITTKEKTVLSYMIEPLIKNWNRALRD